jgi:hypothetical protein
MKKFALPQRYKPSNPRALDLKSGRTVVCLTELVKHRVANDQAIGRLITGSDLTRTSLRSFDAQLGNESRDRLIVDNSGQTHSHHTSGSSAGIGGLRSISSFNLLLQRLLQVLTFGRPPTISASWV